jgi:peptidoglycan-N-acetylglucosamine deacetylase
MPGSKQVFITFDDGPDETVTPKVLDILKQHEVEASFFLTGKNIANHPSLLTRIREEGHAVGNHTYNHLNGFLCRTKDYLTDIEKCNELLATPVFRPPYGRIKPGQAKRLSQNYHIVLWSVLSGDFDPALTADDCIRNVLNHTKEGSIIVFHDSVKAAPRLLQSLPVVISELKQKNLQFGKLIPDIFRTSGKKCINL